MKDIFTWCFKKTAVQVCIVIIMHCCVVSSCINILCCYSCTQGVWFVILIGLYFSQVKNKPWHPWVYSWIWHHREQLQLEFWFDWSSWSEAYSARLLQLKWRLFGLVIAAAVEVILLVLLKLELWFDWSSWSEAYLIWLFGCYSWNEAYLARLL